MEDSFGHLSRTRQSEKNDGGERAPEQQEVGCVLIEMGRSSQGGAGCLIAKNCQITRFPGGAAEELKYLDFNQREGPMA